jgi:hypothetical protein
MEQVLGRDGGSFEVRVAPGDTKATLLLRTEQQVWIGAWQVVAWEALPNEKNGEDVPCAVRVSWIAPPRTDVLLFEGEVDASDAGRHGVDRPLMAGVQVVVAFQLPSPRKHPTRVLFHLERQA